MEQIKLTGKKARALEGLLDGLNIQDAAALAGVNRKTLARWLQEPDFWKAYRNAGDMLFETAARKLASATDGSVDFLVEVREDSDIPTSVRVRAADLVLQHAGKYKDAVDFATRLAALEARLENG